ncbi:MAG: hypothetical protein R3D26_11605 [Cyanobacteriota/Melainabacteria group bacterium]
MQTPVMKSKWSGNELIIGVPPTNPSTGLPEVELPDHLATGNKSPTAPASTSSGVSANQNVEESTKKNLRQKAAAKLQANRNRRREEDRAERKPDEKQVTDSFATGGAKIIAAGKRPGADIVHTTPPCRKDRIVEALSS